MLPAAVAAASGLGSCTTGWLDVDTSPYGYYDYYDPVVVPPPGYSPWLSDPLYGPVYRPGFGPIYGPGFGPGPGLPPPAIRPPQNNGGIVKPSGPNISGGNTTSRPGQSGGLPTVGGQRPGTSVKPDGWGTGSGTGNGGNSGNSNGGLNGQRRAETHAEKGFAVSGL